MRYSVTFWGARGSIPTPGPATARYGGNTPCVSVQGEGSAGNRLVVLDAGTGIRPLGQMLTAAHSAANPGSPRESRTAVSVQMDLLVSHTHWDHIQGLPFFAPFFGPQNQVRIWGAKQGEVDLEVILRQQMNPVVFPVPLDKLAAELKVRHVTPGRFEIDGFAVQAMRLRHPGNTLAYRLTPREGGASMAYVTDNEVGSGGDYDVGPEWRQEFVRFLTGVDLLIHDAMFTPEELERHRGWGHSSNLEAVTIATEAGARRLVLFHHRPEHDDTAVDRLLEQAREAASRTGALEVTAATEGMQLTL
ncbi:MAG: MBL fold metallo-hydrolase [Gemmatimonadetes bacterium]|nr:MBL fold metallo-hydrolase [Gemmatimonadota bacterium]